MLSLFAQFGVDALFTGAQLRHNDFRIFADGSSRNNSENGKTEKKDVSNLFNRFMINKGQTCALNI